MGGNTLTINDRIRNFNEQRALLGRYQPALEWVMLDEELQEYKDAANKAEEIDALCDILVLATGALWKLGIDPDKAMDETLKEIEDRTGAIGTNGKWKKEIRGDEYKADYTQCCVGK